MKRSTKEHLESLRRVAVGMRDDSLIAALDALAASTNLNRQENELARVRKAFPADSLVEVLHNNAAGERRACERTQGYVAALARDKGEPRTRPASVSAPAGRVDNRRGA